MTDASEQNSLKRAQKSAISLADFVAEEALSLVPGGVPIYKLSKILVSHASDFFTERRDERIGEFHRLLISEGDKNYWDEIKDRDIPLSEYYSLLNSVIQDEEDQKVEYYAKVFRLILLEKIEQKYRVHILRSIRELKASDFELLKQIYINEKYERERPGNKRKQIAALTQPDSPLKLYSIQTLIRFGYLSEKDGTKPPWPTKLLKSFVEVMFSENELRA